GGRSGRTDTRRAGDPGELTGPAADLFERLRAWRAAAAKEQGVPAYVVFHDATLRAIAAAAPTTSAQLRAISGVGAAKLERYGPGVLATVAGDDGNDGA
ncbi:HRDC domain-containing protein, partial [Piscicoccus intestinalis]|uniref:HRDC domain-containing protein n=1 Tax=Piscicoccus intestinalis TaxID=746033 RepID=UPI000A772A1D